MTHKMMDTRAWHAMQYQDVLDALGVSRERGLSSREAAERLARWGPNRLPEEAAPGWLPRLAGQFAQPVVLLLIGAAVLAAAIGERIDAMVIGAIVLVNGFLGITQESRAERALRALKAMTMPGATVVRDGASKRIPAEAIVPGDLLVLGAGALTPADARLVEAAALGMSEAMLTGESSPVEKDVDAVRIDTELAERTSMAYQGTLVVRGRALAAVVATGRDTEMGRIAASIAAVRPPPTPMQQRLSALGRILAVGAVGLSVVVIATAAARGIGFADGFFTAVSLAVAAIPEGLPAATTVVLALGVQRMAARNAIVRRLSSVETLGSVTVICVDKTGTLTENKMRVEQIWIDGALHRITDDYVAVADQRILTRALRVAMLCNDAALEAGGAHAGDPTEVALVELARRAGGAAIGDWAHAIRVRELPFDAPRRRMTVVVSLHGEKFGLTKGAPEVIVPRCSRLASATRSVPLDEAMRGSVLASAEAMAARGLRVLALAERYGAADDVPGDELERDLTLLALVGMADPLRPEAPQAIADARDAGVHVIMLTGDHPVTARAIGRSLGFATEDVLTGRDLERVEAELAAAAMRTNVFARMTSDQKLRLIEALRGAGEVVAMTGDGVNDAPALRAADVGVAMGIGGTDVAREAADIVLADNNFRTIVAAIEEGRTIFANIRGFVHYLLTCNLAEVVVVLGALLAAGATPLTPIHILFVNLLTDGLPALALGVEPPEPQFMRRGPRAEQRDILSVSSLVPLLGIGTLIAVPVCGAYAWAQATGDDATASSVTFATVVIAQLAAAVAFRSEERSAFELPRNTWLLLAILASLAALFAVFYVPVLQDAFGTVTLSPGEWAGVAALSLVPLAAVESLKLTGFASARRRS